MTTHTILRLPQVTQRTGLSRSTIYSLIKYGHFPSSILLGARAVGWLVKDVDEWISTRTALSRSPASTGGENE